MVFADSQSGSFRTIIPQSILRITHYAIPQSINTPQRGSGRDKTRQREVTDAGTTVELGIMDSMGKSILYGESKTNGIRFGRFHFVRSFSQERIAQHATLQIMKDKTRQREVTDAGTTVPLSPHLQCRYSDDNMNDAIHRAGEISL